MRGLLKIAGVLLAAVGLLLLVIAWNTLRLPAMPPATGTPMPPPAELDRAAQRLAEAIRIPTVSHGFARPAGGDRFADLHALLERDFPRVHAGLKREKIGSGSLLYTWEGSDPALPPLLLTAHQDVVPVEPGTESGWTHPPFSGDIADGYVWGRGTLDNKQMLMATLEGVERLLAAGAKPKRTVLLAFGHDEELGGPLGARAIADLLAQRNVRALFSLDEGSAILEGVVPGIDRPVAQIGVAEKGFLTLQLTARAKGGHSSMPPPHTAVGKLGRAVARLEERQMPAAPAGPGGDGLRALAPAMGRAARAVIANDWLFGPLLIRQLGAAPTTNAMIRTTTAPTIVQGGVKENVLPTEATAVVNFRIAPGDTVAQVKAHVAAVIDDPDVSIADYRGEGNEATPVADRAGPGFALIGDAARAVAPDAIVSPGLVVTGTDSKHYSRVSAAAYRFLPMRLRPEDIRRIHASDERIAIANYGEIINFYLALIRAAAL
ncbi:MAG: M20 family peptidase [Rhodospirillaceae bacterium]|nr:M20 family peptidase [Rhodospirillaceae bacterium]